MNELTLANQAANWHRLKALVLDSVSSPITRRVYNLGLDEFIAWYGLEPRPGFTKATVNAWRMALEARGLGPISINVRITAVRKLAVEAADNGLLAPELAAGITRVKGAKSKGVRVGNWLSVRQAQTLLNAPDVSTKKGLRDRAMLAILLGCGLRRSEVAALTLKHIQRAVWRDAHSLLGNLADASIRPPILEWISELSGESFDPGGLLALDIAGFCTYQAKVFSWHAESLPLPLALLRQPELCGQLKLALDLAQAGESALVAATRRLRAKAAADKAQPEKWVFVRTDGSGLPLWDSGVRQALKRAAVAEGCDFPGLGPHSFRRANITWRQEVGGSSIEASKIAGHSTVRMTEEYTRIQLTRQEELTRLIQERLASVGDKQTAVVQ